MIAAMSLGVAGDSVLGVRHVARGAGRRSFLMQVGVQGAWGVIPGPSKRAFRG